MTTAAQSHRIAAFTAYCAIAVSWLPVAVLFLRSGGNPDAYLIAALGPYSKIAGLFSILHTLLCVVGAAAVFFRRFDVLAVLPVGPGLALLFYVVVEGFSDPAWFTIVALGSIGEMVAILVALGYWVTKRVARPLDAGTGRETGGHAN